MKKHFFTPVVNWFSKLTDGQKILLPIGAMLLFGFIHFLFNTDGGISGWQTLKQEGGGFWLGLIISVAIIGFLVRAMIRHYSKTQEGSDTTAFLIAIGIFFAIAFGKGCTDKANGGVTTAKGRPITEAKK